MALPWRNNEPEDEADAGAGRVTDDEIRRAMLDGDPDAWQHIMTRLTGTVRGALYRAGVPPLVAHDYAEWVWGRVWERRHQFGRDGCYAVPPFIAWAIRIARNEHVDDVRHFRAHRTYQVTELNATAQFAYAQAADYHEPLPDDAALRAEQQAVAGVVAGIGLEAPAPGLAPGSQRLHLVAMLMAPVRQGPICQSEMANTRPHRELGSAKWLARQQGIGRTAAKSRMYRARDRARQAICAAYGLAPTATLAEVLDRASQQGVTA